MSGNAQAETPTPAEPAFVGSLGRAEVRAELLRDRAQLTSYGIEWSLQQGDKLHPTSDFTRAQARADYIAAREEVRAMNSEGGGSPQPVHAQPRRAITMAATVQR